LLTIPSLVSNKIVTIVVLSLVSPLTARATPSSPAIATPTDTSPTNPPDGASSSSTTAPA